MHPRVTNHAGTTRSEQPPLRPLSRENRHERIFRLRYAIRAGAFAPSATYIAAALLKDRDAAGWLLRKAVR